MGFPFNMDFVLRDLCQPKFRKEAPNKKGEVEIFCPLMTEKHFEVNVRCETWNCFSKCAGCPANGGGGILDLYTLFFGGSRKEAYDSIMRSVDSNTAIVQKRIQQKLEPIQQTESLSHEKLDRTYRELLDVLSLSPEHRKDLEKRGFSQSDIVRMGFKSIPQTGIQTIPQYLKKKGCDIEGVPGFYMKNGSPRICVGGSGFYIPYRDENGLIIGLQIRYDIEFTPDMTAEQIKEAKKRRYRWLTSSNEEFGTSAKNVPFWGMPGYPTKNVAYATEGGLKASAAQSLSGGWFVAIPGVTCYTAWRELLEGLKKRNVTTLVDAFDSDRATNVNVANAIKNLHAIAKEYGFEMKSWDWGTEQKGVDDYLLARRQATMDT